MKILFKYFLNLIGLTGNTCVSKIHILIMILVKNLFKTSRNCLYPW